MSEEENYKGYTISVKQDEDPESPREWDTLGTIYYAHKRYTLGDINLDEIMDQDFESWDDVYTHLLKTYNPVVILPLYLYDHSNIYLKVGDFYNSGLPQGHAYFDSGQIGYILAGKERVQKEYSVKNITKKIKQTVENVLRNEIDIFAKYLSGEVYGFEVTDKQGEFLDSCWGFYDYDEALNEAKSSVDYDIIKTREKKQSRLKTLIKKHVNLQTRMEVLT